MARFGCFSAWPGRAPVELKGHDWLQIHSQQPRTRGVKRHDWTAMGVTRGQYALSPSIHTPTIVIQLHTPPLPHPARTSEFRMIDRRHVSKQLSQGSLVMSKCDAIKHLDSNCQKQRRHKPVRHTETKRKRECMSLIGRLHEYYIRNISILKCPTFQYHTEAVPKKA